MTEREIERWTRDVAENPGAPSFVKLARAYRSQGRREAARDVVLQGLEHNPEHIAGHALLALIYVEDGDRQKAGDEWQTILRLDPDNFDASRGLGFLALEGGDLTGARRHLETAANARPDDPAVSQALEVLARREAREAESGSDTTAAAPEPGGARDREGAGPRTAEGAAGAAGVSSRDPSRLFHLLSTEAPFLGALVLDAQGLVLAGGLEVEAGRGEMLGALINTAVAEARRASKLLGIGAWGGLLLEGEDAVVQVVELPGDAVVLLAARPGAPAGWTVRTAERARALARNFLEERA